MLRRLKGFKLLEGFRGMAAVDVEKLADIVSRVSRFASDHQDSVAELDIKPDRNAKYQLVAAVMADAKNANMIKIGFVSSGE